MGKVEAPKAVSTFDDVPANGSVVVKDNTITVCDAVNTTKVKITKTDITGETELAGATLTITGNGVSKSWTSNGKDIWEVELEDGTYTLKESGKEFTDKNTKKTYKVITTAVKFKVTNGKVTAADDKSVDKVSKVSETEGGVVINGSDLIDASKWYTAIGGGDTVPQFYTYDATNVRLSEAAIGYTFPRKMLWNMFDLTLQVVGKNLLMIYCKAPFDPEATATTTNNYYQGIDYFMMPGVRTYGFNVRLNF
jgi:hypothetical protein